jgi:hypothetical protein
MDTTNVFETTRAYDAACRLIAFAGIMSQEQLATTITKLDAEAERNTDERDRKALKIASIIIQMYQEGSPYNPISVSNPEG